MAVYVPPVNETTSPYQFDGAVTIAGTSASGAMSVSSPSNAGMQAWSFPLALASGTAGALTGQGQQVLAGLNLPLNTSYSNIYLKVATASNGLTSGQCFAGVYSPSGTLVASTAQLATTVGTSTGVITCPLISPFTTTVAGQYWVGCFFNGGTNPALSVFTGLTAITTGATAAAGVATAANYPFAVNGTSLSTALPTSITPSSNSLTSAFVFWAGLG